MLSCGQCSLVAVTVWMQVGIRDMAALINKTLQSDAAPPASLAYGFTSASTCPAELGRSAKNKYDQIRQQFDSIRFGGC